MRCISRLSLAVVCGAVLALGAAGSAQADICPPPNDAPNQACAATFAKLHKGELTFPTDRVDWYRFDWPTPSDMTATLRTRSPNLCVNAEVFDNAISSLGGFGNCANGLASQAADSVDYRVPGGATYAAVTLVRADPLVEYDVQMTRTGGVPAVPTNLFAESVNPTTIRVRWSPHSRDHTGFDVEGNGVVRSTGGTAATYDWTGLTAGTKVCFRVRATNALGASDWYPDVAPSDLCATSKSADGSGGSNGGVPPEAQTPPPPAAPRPPAPTTIPGAPQFVPTPLPGAPPAPAPAPAPAPGPVVGTAPNVGSAVDCRAPLRAERRAANKLQRDLRTLARAKRQKAGARRLRTIRATVRRDRRNLADVRDRIPAAC